MNSTENPTNGHNGNGSNGHSKARKNPKLHSGLDSMQSKYIWMDGEFVLFEDATVHFLTPTLHYGTGVFEGIRCYETEKGPAIFRLHDHMKRFLDSAKVAGIMELPYSLDELKEAVHRTVQANGFASCYIRPLIYMVGTLGLNLDSWCPAVGIAAWKWGALLGDEASENGIRLMVSSFTRHHPNASMTKAKLVGNYVNSTLAKTMASRSGFDEAILLDPEGYVAECSGENLFVVRSGKLYTSSRSTVLEGITRDTLFRLASDLGIAVVEEPLSRDQLYISDEVFLCGTAAEVVPVREIDYRVIGDGKKGPVTKALQDCFRDTVSGRGAHSQEWLEYVDEALFAM